MILWTALVGIGCLVQLISGSTSTPATVFPTEQPATTVTTSVAATTTILSPTPKINSTTTASTNSTLITNEVTTAVPVSTNTTISTSTTSSSSRTNSTWFTTTSTVAASTTTDNSTSITTTAEPSNVTTSPITAPTTTSNVTTSPITAPTTTSNVTTSPITVPTTTSNVTTSPITAPTTTSNVTTSPITVPTTTSNVTTSPITVHTTTSNVTTSPITVPTTTSNVTTSPITTSNVTTSPITTSNVTTSPITVPTTTSNVTTSPITTSNVTTSPITVSTTTSNVTTSPITTSNVTTSPITVPTTTSNVTTSPITTSNVTTSPITTSNVTTSPITAPTTTGNTTSMVTPTRLSNVTTTSTTAPTTTDIFTSIETTVEPSNVTTTSITASSTTDNFTGIEITTEPSNVTTTSTTASSTMDNFTSIETTVEPSNVTTTSTTASSTTDIFTSIETTVEPSNVTTNSTNAPSTTDIFTSIETTVELSNVTTNSTNAPSTTDIFTSIETTVEPSNVTTTSTNAPSTTDIFTSIETTVEPSNVTTTSTNAPSTTDIFTSIETTVEPSNVTTTSTNAPSTTDIFTSIETTVEPSNITTTSTNAPSTTDIFTSIETTVEPSNITTTSTNAPSTTDIFTSIETTVEPSNVTTTSTIAPTTTDNFTSIETTTEPSNVTTTSTNAPSTTDNFTSIETTVEPSNVTTSTTASTTTSYTTEQPTTTTTLYTSTTSESSTQSTTTESQIGFDCGIPPPPGSGSWLYNNTTVGYNATLFCFIGFDVTGDDTIICTNTGWDGLGICTAIDCGDPTPSNGFADKPNTTYGSVIQLGCSQGYFLNGSSFVQCLGDGTWSDTTTCDLKDCGDPTPVNGTVNSTDTTLGARINVTCNTGFAITGPQVIVCQLNESWSASPFCTITDCGVPVLGNASINSTGTTYGESAVVQCDTGFDINGSSTIMCLADGKWSALPTCKITECAADPTPAYGAVNSTDSIYGSVILVTCIPGYKINGSSVITCQATGMWSDDPFCSLIVCPNVTGENGWITYSNYTFNSTAILSCNLGYRVSNGPNLTICRDTSIWAPTLGQCDVDPNFCSTSPSVSNGNFSYIGSHLNATANITCNDGYELSGETLITCLSSGKWSNDSQCNPVDCGTITSIKNGQGILVQAGNTSLGSTANVTCDPGYETNKAHIECLVSGVWDTALCGVKVCGTVPNITNGQIIIVDDNSTSFGATANVTCDPGYETNITHIECLASGIWDTALCEAKDCGMVRFIKNGHYTLVDASNTSFGATANVTCDPGFETNKTHIECLASGVWDTAMCTVKDCRTVPVIINGQYTLVDASNTSLGANANVTCDPGYETNKTHIRCLASGVWDIAMCTVKDCGTVLIITNGQFTLVDASNTSFGAAANVTCDPGYETNKTYIECLASGMWDTTTCAVKDCGTVPGITNGQYTLVDGSNTSFGATANVSCDTGYRTIKTYIECLASGMWDIAACAVKDCGTVPVITNGQYSLVDASNTSFGSAANVTCDLGYETNKTHIECLASGVWGTAMCTVKDCGTVLIITNGQYTLVDATNTSFGAAANVTCDPGYETNKTYIECLASGMWDTATCAVKDCGTVPGIKNGQYILVDGSNTSFGATANVSCDTGYGTNKTYIECLASGMWDTAACAVKDCGTVLVITNGQYSLVDASNTSFGSAANVTCDLGYETNKTHIECLASGVWGTAMCTVKDCRTVPSITNGEYTLVNASNTSFGAAANVTCDPGYETNKTQIECLASGTWGTSMCTRKDCGSLPQVPNGNSVLVDTSNSSFGAYANVTCNDGFSSNVTQIMCLASGEWQSESCSAKDCGVLPSIQNGQLVLADGSSLYESAANVTCNPGHGSNVTQVYCLHTGEWDTTACYSKDCGPLTNPVNGQVETKSGTTFNQIATYSCVLGYDLSGDISRRCVVDETSVSWSGSEPSCEIKDCGVTSLSSPNNGAFSDPKVTTFGSNVTYTCNPGYNLIGDDIRFCLASGIWSGLKPICENIPVKTCPKNTDSRSNIWNEALVGETRRMDCSPGSSGNVTRYCRPDGKWELPKYNCIRTEINTVNNQVNETLQNPTTDTIDKLLEQIADVTTQNSTTTEETRLTDAELTTLTSSLESVADALANVNSSDVDVAKIADNFVASASNLLDTTNTERWKSLKESNSNDGAEKVMSAVDSIGSALRTQLQNNATSSTQTIIKTNIAIEVKKVDTDVVFPSSADAQAEEWVGNSNSKIDLDHDALKGKGEFVTTAVMYRDMSDILPTSTKQNNASDDVLINGPILAMSISPPIAKLSPPIRMTFGHFLTNYSEPSCTFWAYSSTSDAQGYWSDDGCQVNDELSNENTTVCECDHLTNFAILMSPFVEADDASKALRIISIVGIAISILCLLITVVLHMCLWRNVRSDRTTLLMNLCVALLISYVVFLAGVDRTESAAFCVFVAALLQYIYLVVFCLMLAEGIELVFTVIVVFATRSRIRKLLVIAWVLPAIIVGISLGVTKTEGYGNESFCWLSVDSGLIWAFVGPALAVILFNLICLIIVFRSMFKMKSMESKTTKEKIKTSFRSLCVLVPLMGVSWILGIFYINESMYFMQYLFAIVNGLQGFFIFLFHCVLNNKVKNAMTLKAKRRSTQTTWRSHSHDKGKKYSKDLSKNLSESRDFHSSPDWRDKVLAVGKEEGDSSFQMPLGGVNRGSLSIKLPFVAFNGGPRDSWSGDNSSSRNNTRYSHDKHQPMHDNNAISFDEQITSEHL